MTTQVIEIGSSFWVRLLDPTGCAWLIHRFDTPAAADEYRAVFAARYQGVRESGELIEAAVERAGRYADGWLDRQRVGVA